MKKLLAPAPFIKLGYVALTPMRSRIETQAGNGTELVYTVDKILLKISVAYNCAFPFLSQGEGPSIKCEVMFTDKVIKICTIPMPLILLTYLIP